MQNSYHAYVAFPFTMVKNTKQCIDVEPTVNVDPVHLNQCYCSSFLADMFNPNRSHKSSYP